MAGGKGTRLASITKNIPKPMVTIAGKPLLEYQIENLKENGVDNIILVVGHLGEVIREHFGDGTAFGVNISYFIEETPLGTAGALTKMKGRLENTFFLVFGDLFVNINYDRFLGFHRDCMALITLFVHPNSHPYDSDIVVTSNESRVIGWSYKKEIRTKDYKNLVNAGLYVMEKTVVNEIERVQKIKGSNKVDLEKELIIPIISKMPIYAYHGTEYVKDIGTPDRLEKVTADFLNGVCEQRNLKHKQKCIFLDREGTINKNVGFLKDAEQVELERGAAEALRLINESEYLAIAITRQPVVDCGKCNFEELERIHNRIYTLLGKEGAYLDGLYFCPHHPDKGFDDEISEFKFDCDCRRPKTGMLERAESDFNVDLTQSWFIGDTTVDVQTGINAGMRTVILETGDPRKNEKYDVRADAVCHDLLSAVRYVLKKEREESVC